MPLHPGSAISSTACTCGASAVHGPARHPPVGQVLDGGLARPPDPDLDHRRGRLRGLDRGVLHRLRVAAEVRLAEDLHERQGRVQLRRRRRVLQRDELRPDADVAHRAAPDRADRHLRRARAAGPGARGVAPDRHRSRRRRGTRTAAPARHRSGQRRSLARPEPALRHPEGRHHRRGDRAGAHRGPGRRAVLPGRAAGHRRHLGQARARRLPGHRRHRAERNQRDRHLRPALQQPQPAAPSGCCSPRPTIAGVTQPVDTAQDFVLGPLASLAPADPAIAAPLATYPRPPPPSSRSGPTPTTPP